MTLPTVKKISLRNKTMKEKPITLSPLEFEEAVEMMMLRAKPEPESQKHPSKKPQAKLNPKKPKTASKKGSSKGASWNE